MQGNFKNMRHVFIKLILSYLHFFNQIVSLHTGYSYNNNIVCKINLYKINFLLRYFRKYYENIIAFHANLVTETNMYYLYTSHAKLES